MLVVDTTQSNLETVRGIYDAFAEGDIETVLAAFADDITWVEATDGPYGGSYNGPGQVVESVFGPIDEEWEKFLVVHFHQHIDTVLHDKPLTTTT